MVAFRIADRSIGLVSTIVLARLLVPTDFGLLAMATSIIGALALLGAFNFDLALIQHASPDRRHFDTVWTFDVIVGAISALALLVLALPAASFYREPRLAAVMITLALSVFVGGLQNVGVIAFRKELNFDREFYFLMGPRLLGFVVTIASAIALRNYWALVAGMTTSKVAAVVMSYVVHPYRPKPSLQARRELFHFSQWLLVNNLLNFVNGRASDFIIGRISGTHSLGVYGLAVEVSSLPTTELAAPIQRAAYPGYSAMAGDAAVLRRGFLDVLSGSALLVVPAAIGIAMIADPMVQVILGPQWLESIALIQVLAFYGLAVAFEGNAGYLYLAIGKPRVLTLISGLGALVLLPMLILTTNRFGMQGAAWAVLAVAIASLFPLYGILIRVLHISARQLLAAIWRPLVAGTIMALILHTVELMYFSVTGRSAELSLLMSLILSGVLSYIVIVVALWWLSSRPRGAETFVLERLLDVLSKFRRRRR
jgi:O-antigen/teichoic acid export membrane protein